MSAPRKETQMALLLLGATLVVAIGLGSGLLALFGDPAEDAFGR
jgi:hypothetical protein